MTDANRMQQLGRHLRVANLTLDGLSHELGRDERAKAVHLRLENKIGMIEGLRNPQEPHWGDAHGKDIVPD